MDRSEEAKAQAQVLNRTLETVCRRLIAEKGFTSEQVGVALGAASLTFLSEAWGGREIVDHLLGLARAMADVHGIDPATGEEVSRGRPN